MSDGVHKLFYATKTRLTLCHLWGIKQYQWVRELAWLWSATHDIRAVKLMETLNNECNEEDLDTKFNKLWKCGPNTPTPF